MKLSESTIEIITSIRNLNPGCVFKAGNVIKAKQHKATAPIILAVIPEEFPRDFAIFDLKKFINMFSLLEDPELEFEDDCVVFSDAKGRSATIKYSPPTVIDHHDYSKKITLPSTDIEFRMEAADFIGIRKAAAAFVAPEIAFVANGKKLSVITNDSKNTSADKFEIQIGKTDQKFKIILDTSGIQFLPKTYDVKICYKGLLQFTTEDGSLTYWITSSDKSKIG